MIKWNRWSALFIVLAIFVVQAVAWATTGDSLYGLTFLAFGSLAWAIGAVCEAHRISSAGQRWTAVSFFVMFLLFGSLAASVIDNTYWSWGFLAAAAIGGPTLAMILQLLRPIPEDKDVFKPSKESSTNSLPYRFFFWLLTVGLFLLVALPLLSTISLSELEKRHTIIPAVALLGWILLLFLIYNIAYLISLIKWFKARSKD